MLHVTRFKGFTLIELLIYTAILSIVLVFTGQYLFSIGQARLTNNSRTEVAKNAEMVINKIKLDFTDLNSLIVPSDASQTNNLQITDSNDNDINYQLINNILVRSVNLVKNDLTNNQVNISNLSFQKITNTGGKETIQIKFTLTSIAQLSAGRQVSEDFQTTVSKR